MSIQLSRRGLLLAAGGALAVTASAGCDAFSTKSTDDSGSDGTSGGENNPKQAPMLADDVQSGKLPPLAQRLPASPLVVPPKDRIGAYGGELRIRLAESVPLGVQRIYFVAGYDNLVSWDAEFTRLVPNLARRYSVNDEGSEWTFDLREGIKWSDGTPFTAADVVFAVNDYLMNVELTPAVPSWLGEVTATAEGEHTVRLKLARPNALLAEQMATNHGREFTVCPRHVLEQYHKKYNSKIDELVQRENMGNWVDLFLSHIAFSDGHSSYQTPTLTAWRYVTPPDASPNVTLERNPYYWKVDPRGSQLPYVDRLIFTRANDEVAVLKLSNGDFDFETPIPVPANKPEFASNRSHGDYHFTDESTEYMNNLVLHLNLTHQDPVKRAVFGNKDFRIGLSYAINREEVIDAVFLRQGTPWQTAPRKESRFYDEEMATQYTDYDVDAANRHLDKAFPDKDDDGMRLGPDGQPISFKFNTATEGSTASTLVDSLELLSKYWREVGVDMQVNSMSRELMITTAEANLHDAVVWAGEGGLDQVIMLNPYNYLPNKEPWSLFAVAWANWYVTRGQQGERPPASVVRQLQLYDELMATTDAGERDELMRQILRIAKENFYTIGVVSPGQSYRTVTDRVKNWPSFTAQGDWVYSSPGPTNPCQYYIEED